MPEFDELIGKWVQERLLHGALVADTGASGQVSDAVAELRKNFSPKKAEDASAAVDKWFADSFMGKPPLTHNTPAFNQVSAAAANLKERLAAALEEQPAPPAPPPPPPPAPPAPKPQPSEDKE